MFIRGMQLEVRLEEDLTYTLRQNSNVIGVAGTYDEALAKYEETRQGLLKETRR